jgi:peptidoglycan/LPS O-acetylase OafA/YrhL
LIALAAAGLGVQLAGQAWLVQVSRVDQAPPFLAGWLLRSEGRSPLHWLGFLTAGLALGSLFARGWRPPLWSRWLALPALLLHFWLALRPPQAPRFDDFWCSPAMTGGFVLFLLWAWPLVALGSASKSPWIARMDAGLAALGRRSLPVYLGHIAWLRLAWWAVGDSWPLPWALLAALLAMVGGTWAYLPVHDRLFSPRPAAALS